MSVHNITIFCDSKNKSQTEVLKYIFGFIRSRSKNIKSNNINLKILNSPSFNVVCCKYNKLSITNPNEILNLINDLTKPKKQKQKEFRSYIQDSLFEADSSTSEPPAESKDRFKEMLSIIEHEPSDSPADLEVMVDDNIKSKIKAVKETALEHYISDFTKDDNFE